MSFSPSENSSVDEKNRYIEDGPLDFDYSRNLINEEVLDKLYELAEQCELPNSIEAMFSGQAINKTEGRSVLHTALRNPENFDFEIQGLNIKNEVKQSLRKMESFCARLHNGEFKGSTGKSIKDLVNIGIGGSDLGPAMVVRALSNYQDKGIKPHFISNVDSTQADEVLNDLDPETTLFLISSKTFTTQETMANAGLAKAWALENLRSPQAISNHFLAISTNIKGALEFGISEENIFGFWDWVGGRYSLWSSIGLSIACTIGYDRFKELLSGAADADRHFKTENFEKNIPVTMALLGIWNGNFLNADSEAVLPYAQQLDRFPAYLQQANMESNGKSISRANGEVSYKTGPVVWGEPGTNGQHAFHQLIHQGTRLIPCDFILVKKNLGSSSDQHKILLANGMAQSKALWDGKTIDEVRIDLDKKGIAHSFAQHRVFSGKRPSNIISLDDLNPYSLGYLIATYEHKIFVQGIIWNIFSFDQWGVELGKVLTPSILSALNSDSENDPIDPVSDRILRKLKR